MFSSQALAHIRGIPIMKINGKDTKIYPSQLTTSLVFDLPADADSAPESYLKNQKLLFVIDTKNLPLPEDVLKKTQMTWDFGDGSKVETLKGGLKNTHTYKTSGTFIMQVTADYSTAGYEDLGRQPVQTTVLHILPYAHYVLPKGTIKVNDIITSEKKAQDIDLNKAITFEVVRTSSELYQWDFGDGTTSTDQKVTHRYRLPQYYVSPLLRIRDANGFFTDTYVNIRNSGKNDPNNPEQEEMIWNGVKIGIGIVCLGIGIFILYRKRKRI